MKSMITNASLLLLALTSGGTMALAVPTSHQVPNPVAHHTTRSKPTLPATLRPALYRALAKDASVAYRVNKDGCAVLPRQALKGCFDARGAHFSGPGATPLVLYLAAYGRGSEWTSVTPVRPTIRDNRVSYRHGALTAWWRVLPMGFEQGFTIAKRPGGQGKLTLALAASGKATQRAGALAWGKLRYGELVVTDAQGKVVPATLKTKGDCILIAVNDARATYPLTVDPLVYLEQIVTASDGASQDQFGFSVALAGTTALIGAVTATVNGTPFVGAVYVFTDSGGTWSQTQKLTPNDGVKNENFGLAVALAGNTALIGTPNAIINGNIGQGAVYVFTDSGGTWSQTQKLTASDGAQYEQFGASVALAGTTALIGMPNGGAPRDAVYVFTDSGGTWTQMQKLTASDGAQAFGNSVALAGSTALVGANGATVNGNPAQGAVYVFTNSGGTWTQTQRFSASDGGQGEQFGFSVALAGSTALITEPNGGAFGGVAYIFTDSGGTWSQTAELAASDGVPFDGFGSSIALAGGTALVGAKTAGPDDGAVYVFTDSGGTWSQTRKITAPNHLGYAYFGYSVALAGTTMLIGAPLLTVNHNVSQGTAYFLGESDLGLAVSAPASASAGQTFVSQTIATNASSMASPAVALTVAVPAAASFVSASASQGSCNEASGVVTCALGSITGNAGTASANVTLRAPGNANAATLKYLAGIVEATPPLTASAATMINHLPVDLAMLSGNVSPTGTVKKGEDLVYVLTVQNVATNRYAAATQTQLSYHLPSGVTYLAASGAATSCAPAAGGTVVCGFGILQPGASKLEKLAVQVTEDATTIASTFTVSAAETDSDPSNNSLTLSTNPNTGPPGSPGPKGSSGGGGFGGIALLALLALILGAGLGRRRHGQGSVRAKIYGRSVFMICEKIMQSFEVPGNRVFRLFFHPIPVAGCAVASVWVNSGVDNES
ncbi:MAG: hypothetical protein ACRES9_09560 [Gammaproteobacteria bacterium]